MNLSHFLTINHITTNLQYQFKHHTEQVEKFKMSTELAEKGLLNNKTLKSSPPAKEQWGNDIEFLFSCISLSVGLGNIWRFPYIAFQNGGGAFVIPYLIVLLIIGRPVYYLEILVGQFSGRGCIKAFDMAPVLKGKFYLFKCC